MYPDAAVATFVNDEFVPVKIHVKEQPKEFQRFGAEWTPTIIVLDPQTRTERHRIEGFLPREEFLAQLALARGQFAFGREQWDEARRFFTRAAEVNGAADAAAEGLYWSGVAEYKKTGEAQALGATWKALSARHPESIWAKKASVWAG